MLISMKQRAKFRALETNCCMGYAGMGKHRCTCWRPVYDKDQAPIQEDESVIRRKKQCHDCAFKKNSKERAAGVDLENLPHFWCHLGMRRAIYEKHEVSGRARKLLSRGTHYCPPIKNGIPRKTDGKPAEYCAGWLKANPHREPERAEGKLPKMVVLGGHHVDDFL
jgi:hypothetical protein